MLSARQLDYPYRRAHSFASSIWFLKHDTYKKNKIKKYVLVKWDATVVALLRFSFQPPGAQCIFIIFQLLWQPATHVHVWPNQGQTTYLMTVVAWFFPRVFYMVLFPLFKRGRWRQNGKKNVMLQILYVTKQVCPRSTKNIGCFKLGMHACYKCWYLQYLSHLKRV